MSSAFDKSCVPLTVHRSGVGWLQHMHQIEDGVVKVRSVAFLLVALIGMTSGCVRNPPPATYRVPADCLILMESVGGRGLAISSCGDAAPHPQHNAYRPRTGASAAANEVADATVGCSKTASSEAPSEPPRPPDAAPVRYLANERSDPSTFVTPASIFAKLGVSETTTPLKLKRCLERWFQTCAAQIGTMFVIEARRMVYEVVTTFEFYEGRGGAWAQDTAPSSSMPRPATRSRRRPAVI